MGTTSQRYMKPVVRQARRVRGAAMIETVLGLPFLLAVLLIIFFLGREWMRQQHAEDTVYYDAWQAAERADGPSDVLAYESGMVRTDPEITIDVFDTFPQALADNTLQAIGNIDPDAALFAEVVMDDLPSGVLREHQTGYPANGVTTTLTRWFPDAPGFSNGIRAFHLRMDQPWPHVLDEGYEHPATGSGDTLGHYDTIRDEYMTNLSESLDAISGNNGVADLTHGTLGRLANYRGPAFPDD